MVERCGLFVRGNGGSSEVRRGRRKDLWRSSPSSRTIPASSSTRVTPVSRTTGSSRPFTPALTIRPGRSGGEQTARVGPFRFHSGRPRPTSFSERYFATTLDSARYPEKRTGSDISPCIRISYIYIAGSRRSIRPTRPPD